MTGPLMLTNVPGGVQQLYKTLTTFITEECGLSIRYVTGESMTRIKDAAELRKKICDAIINNDSLRMRPLIWELDTNGHVVLPQHLYADYPSVIGPASRVRFRKDIQRTTAEATAEIEQLVSEVLADQLGVIKLIGLDVIREGEKCVLPIWGWGMSASEYDREIKFIFCDDRIDSLQLHMACLLHSLIETCWWYPLHQPEDAPPPVIGSAEDKRFISAMVDDNLCYFNMSVVVLLERLQVFEQHFEDAAGRPHTPSQCACQKKKAYAHSFLMRKVNTIKHLLLQQNLDSNNFHTWLYENIQTGSGPTPELALYLQLLADAASHN